MGSIRETRQVLAEQALRESRIVRCLTANPTHRFRLQQR
jgi:hypothetical protein